MSDKIKEVLNKKANIKESSLSAEEQIKLLDEKINKVISESVKKEEKMKFAPKKGELKEEEEILSDDELDVELKDTVAEIEKELGEGIEDKELSDEEEVEESIRKGISWAERKKAPQRESVIDARKTNFDILEEMYENMSDEDEIEIEGDEDFELEDLSDDDILEMEGEHKGEEHKEDMTQEINLDELKDFMDSEEDESHEEEKVAETEMEISEEEMMGEVEECNECNEEEIMEKMYEEYVKTVDETQATDEGKLEINKSKSGITTIKHFPEEHEEEVKKLKEELKDLKSKNAMMVKENAELKSTLKEIAEDFKQTRLYTESLVYINKLFMENATSQNEKQKIMESFSNIKTINEARELYATLSKQLKESTLAITKKSVVAEGTVKITETTKTNPDLSNFNRLAGLNKTKK